MGIFPIGPLGCSGFIGGEGVEGAMGERGAGGRDAAGDGVERTPPGNAGGAGAALSAPPASMLRLTTAQYRNTIADVFGPAIRLPDAIDVDDESELFLSMGAAKVATAPRGVEQYHDAALAIATQVFADPARVPILNGCAPSATDDPCIGTVLRSIGRRLFRRPLTDDELDRYRSIVGSAGEEADVVRLGMTYAVATLLASPNFLYVPIVGGDPVDGVKPLTGFELATRLALALWNSSPDEELLDAAEQGALDSDAGLSDQLDRMLASDHARDLLSRFLGESWTLSNLAVDAKPMDRYPQWDEALIGSYRNEWDDVLRELAFERDGDLRELFASRTTLVDERLAQIYGVSLDDAERTSNGAFRIDLPDDRAGLFTSPVVIAAITPGARTSPTHRGVFVLERVLCGTAPPPPPNVNNMLTPDDEPQEGDTTRELLERHRSDPACASCHGEFDPLGLTFERFDTIGARMEGDIDSSGEWQDMQFSGASELAAFLADDPRPVSCMVKRFYSFAMASRPSEEDEGTLDSISAAFAGDGRRFLTLLRTLLTDPAFAWVSEEGS